MRKSDREWPLLLKTGFGNVFSTGRWTHASVILIADAINSKKPSAWRLVEEWARTNPWDELKAS